jgi:hypothetical protein
VWWGNSLAGSNPALSVEYESGAALRDYQSQGVQQRTSLSLCEADEPMMTRLVFVILLAPLFATPSAAQSCRAADDNSAFMIGDLKSLVSSTNPQNGYQRRDLRIPVVDPSTIVLISQTRTWNKALTAFLTTLPAGYPTPLPTSVYVVKVGDVYVVIHPPPAGLKGDVYAVLDSKFRVLAKYSL